MAHVIPTLPCSFFLFFSITREILLRPMKFRQKLIENANGATQSPMNLQTASRVTRDYGN